MQPDIIQTALDILTGDGQRVRVLLQRPGRAAVFLYGRLTGLGSMGKDATITITDIRTVGDVFIPGNLLLDVADVHSLTALGR